MTAYWVRIEHPIPNPEKLWRSLNKRDQVYANGRPKPAFFRDSRGGLSVDLARFSTPEKSRRGYGVPPQWPEESGLVEITVELARSCGTDVQHRPVREPFENFAHSQFTADLSTAEQKKLAEQAVFLVPQRIRA